MNIVSECNSNRKDDDSKTPLLPLNVTPPPSSGTGEVVPKKRHLQIIRKEAAPTGSNKDESSSEEARSQWKRRFTLSATILVWYSLGVSAIVTTKTLVQEWSCPPLMLTVQQMVLASIIIRIVISVRDGVPQPLPWEQQSHSNKQDETSELWHDKLQRYLPWLAHSSFVLVGVFNALDFLSSNFAFSFSNANFVEAVKSSDPITTATIAVIGKVDQISTMEGCSLLILVSGVILSTLGNSSDQTHGVQTDKLMESAQTAGITMFANLCFGFRAMQQKKYRSITNETQQLDDVNLFYRMLQTGAFFLSFPLLVLHWQDLIFAIELPMNVKLTYFGVAAVNAFSYVVYKYVV